MALIDICSILIIFLIKGAYFGQTSIDAPADLVFPVSVNRDDVMQAPQVLVFNNKVKSNIVEGEYSVEKFREQAARTELEDYKRKIEAYVQKLPSDQKKDGVYLNVVADKETSYRDVFDVLQFYRAAGFESVLFVAEGSQ